MEQQPQQTSFLMNPNAKWLVPVLSAIVGFACCCISMLVLYYGALFAMLGENYPTTYQEGYDLGQRMSAQNPMFTVVIWVMCCLPFLTTILAAVGSFVFVNSYQKRNTPPPPMVSG